MMASLSDVIRALLIDQQVDAIRFAEGLDEDVQARLDRLGRAVRRLLADFDGTSRTAFEVLIGQVNALVNSSFGEISEEQLRQLQAFAAAVGEGTATAVNTTVGVAVVRVPNRLSARVARMVINGAASSEWWAGQAYSTRRAFAREVRTGFVNGETTDQIARRIAGAKGMPGVMEIARRQARSLVHTSIQAVANQSRQEVFKANEDVVQGVDWLATLDSHTCPLCGARDGLSFTLGGRPVGHSLTWNGGPGSIHFGCRCVAVPVMKPIEVGGVTLDFSPTQRASQDGPVPASMTFQQWLDGKGRDFQDEYFGEVRAELYRRGKLTLSDLLDMRGRALTLDQLRSKYALSPA